MGKQCTWEEHRRKVKILRESANRPVATCGGLWPPVLPKSCPYKKLVHRSIGAYRPGGFDAAGLEASWLPGRLAGSGLLAGCLKELKIGRLEP